MKYFDCGFFRLVPALVHFPIVASPYLRLSLHLATLYRRVLQRKTAIFPTTRVDLNRPKTLIIQFHKLNLRKNTNHTNSCKVGNGGVTRAEKNAPLLYLEICFCSFWDLKIDNQKAKITVKSPFITENRNS